VVRVALALNVQKHIKEGSFEAEIFFIYWLSGEPLFIGEYYPWSYFGNLSKSSQPKNVFRWQSKDNLAGYIASFHKINLWIRGFENENMAVAFTNSSFDPAYDIKLMLRTSRNHIKVLDMKCKEQRIMSTCTDTDGPYQNFIIPYTAPWEMQMVIADP